MSKVLEFPNKNAREQKNTESKKAAPKSTAAAQRAKRLEAKIKKYLDKMSYNVFEQLIYNFTKKDYEKTNDIAYSDPAIMAQRIYYVLTELDPVDDDTAYDAANYVMKPINVINKYVYYETLCKAYITDFFEGLYYELDESGEFPKGGLKDLYKTFTMIQSILFDKDKVVPSDILKVVIPPSELERLYSLLYVYGLAHFGHYKSLIDTTELILEGKLSPDAIMNRTAYLDPDIDKEKRLAELKQDRIPITAEKEKFINAIPKEYIETDQFDWYIDELE